MLFKVETTRFNLDVIREMCSKYPFAVEDGSDLEVKWRDVNVAKSDGSIVHLDEQYPFAESQYGVLITDLDQYYRGLTSTYGQTSVYWSKSDEKKAKWLSYTVMRLRMAHEILHHFNKPCHDIEKWLADKPFLSILWVIGGSGKRYSLFECLCKDMYYDYLFRDIDEDAFNALNDMERRSPRGVLNI